MTRVSLLTIVRGRDLHLRNQLQGILQSQVLPSEWVVCSMNQDELVWLRRAGTPFPVRQTTIHTEGALPLAAARNRAASQATGDVLIFLDVDCIPGPEFIRQLTAAVLAEKRLWMGSVGYLAENFPKSGWRSEQLEAFSIPHPRMPDLGGDERLDSDRYEMFWSLCFGLHRETFQKLGGFDEGYIGYGAEDTDFAFQARAQQIPFGFVGAKAYHQHHPVCKPPLPHLEAIVGNAKRFYDKWGIWPMESWLRQFAASGFIHFDPEAEELTLHRLPTPAEIQACEVRTPAGF